MPLPMPRSGALQADHQGHGHQNGLARRRHRQHPSPPRSQMGDEPAADHRARRRRPRARTTRRAMEKPLAAGQGEGQEDHVAGHVGHEHVPEDQVAEGIHQPGDHGQRHQEGSQRTVAVVPPEAPASARRRSRLTAWVHLRSAGLAGLSVHRVAARSPTVPRARSSGRCPPIRAAAGRGRPVTRCPRIRPGPIRAVRWPAGRDGWWARPTPES